MEDRTYPIVDLWPHQQRNRAVPGRMVTHLPDSFLPARIVRNVTVPNMTVHRPAPAAANGAAVIVCPGGGFHFHSIDTEGYEVADYLAARGFTAFTLEYRLASTPKDDGEAYRRIIELLTGRANLADLMRQQQPDALADGLTAIEAVRARANEWGIDRSKVGIVGFSAGGYVAAGTALRGTGESRPDFCGAIYAVDWTDAVAPVDAGPLFVAMSADDPIGAPIIDTGYALHRAWRDAGRPVELHVYQDGGHGYGTRQQGTTSDAWLEQLHAWIAYNVR